MIVRDRREPRQFTVGNGVIDDWFPIIGVTGLALYVFYVRLSNRKDERAFPGYRLVRRDLGYSRGTHMLHNSLLVWCQLIHIEVGNRRKSNDYYILETPVCDEEALERVRRRCLDGFDGVADYEQKFRLRILGRVDGWKPVQHWWSLHGQRRKIVTGTRAQMEMYLSGVDEVETEATATP